MRIKVFGNGLIPRGYGLAPLTTPIDVNEQTFYTILNTAGLRVELEDPNGVFVKVTPGTAGNIIDKFKTMKKEEVKEDKEPQIKPVVPENKFDNVPITTLEMNSNENLSVVVSPMSVTTTEDQIENSTEEEKKDENNNFNSYKNNNKKHKK